MEQGRLRPAWFPTKKWRSKEERHRFLHINVQKAGLPGL
jgi:hypothetical protein